jgi:hypothetical protein
MARAGYCSGCGTYVYLRPDGYCVNGHPPQSVSNIYEAPDASAPPAAFAVPAAQPGQPAAAVPQPYQPPPAQPAYQQPATQPYQQQAQPAYQQPPAQPAYQQPAAAPAYGAPQYAAPAAAPKKSRGGLIAVILVVLLLVCGGGGVAAAVVFGVLPNPTDLLASPAHQKVAAAGDFIEAFSTANIVLFRKSLPTDAANAANPTYWISKLSQANGVAKLESKTWAGDKLTMVFVDTDGTKRQFVLTSNATSDTVTASASDVGATDSGSDMNFQMVKELAGYKVLALVAPDGTEYIRFTPEMIKKFETENP